MKSKTVSMGNRPLMLLVAFALLVAACGGETNSPAITGDLGAGQTEANEESDEAMEDDAMEDDAESDAMEEDDAAATEGDDTADEPDADAEVPSRIVSLSATSTEVLFAIGAGEQVIAADSFSNYPADAPTTELSAFEPSLEAIAAEDPDLVIISFDPGDIVSGLGELGITTIVHPAAATLDDVYAQIADLGIATGNEDGAAEVVAEIRSGIDEIVAAAPASDTPIRVYHELDDTFFSATSSSFIGQLYGLLGVENVADAADPDNESFGFPQLSAEYLLEADPQMIVITDQVGYSVEDVADRPGWDAMSAVQNGGVIQVDADIASRWGPRVVDFLQFISDALAEQLVDA